MDRIHSKWRAPTARVKEGRLSTLEKARAARESKRQESLEEVRPSASTSASQETGTQEKLTASIKGRTRKKIDLFVRKDPASTHNEYVLVHTDALNGLVQDFECTVCHNKKCFADTSVKKGAAVLIKVICSDCGTERKAIYSSPHTSKSEKSTFEVNQKLVSAFSNNGLGHTTMMRIGAGLGLYVMDLSSYQAILKGISKTTSDKKEEILKEAREAVRKCYHSEHGASEDPILDVAVSVDGSWHKRGHTSLYGFVAVVEIMTGLVIDYEILSKYCHLCISSASALGEDSPEFFFWHEAHLKASECNINYSGTSGGMESEGALRLWKRSIENCHMRYTTFIADGDTKTFAELKKEKPYGPDIQIQKEECVNHLSKRMGKALSGFVSDQKKRGVTLGGRGEGTLTEETIKTLQGYYHSAVKKNSPSVPKMKQAVLATLYHCQSTDKKHDHSKCPLDVNSWCFFNKRKARKEKDLGTHNDMPIKINQKVFKALLPHYERLSSDELMSRCTKGATQNANECLHSVIWNKCSKTCFISKPRVEISVAQAVGEFNMGCSALLEVQARVDNAPVSQVAQVVAAKLDKKRKAKSDAQATAEAKRRRVQRKKQVTQKRVTERKKYGEKYTPGGGD